MKVNKEDLPEEIAEKIEDDEVEFEMSDEAMELLVDDQLLRKQAREQRASRMLEKTQEELKSLTSLLDKKEKGVIDAKTLRRKVKKAQRYHKSSLFEVRMLDKRSNPNGV